MWPSSVKGRPWTIASSRTAAEKASLRPARRRVAATRSASAWSGGAARAMPIAGAGAPTGSGTKTGGGRGHGDDRHDLGRGVARMRDGVDGGVDVRAQRCARCAAASGVASAGRRALGGRQRGGEAGRRGAAGQPGSDLGRGRHRLGHDRGVVVEQRRPGGVGGQQRRSAGLGLDLDHGPLEEAGDAALEALAAADDHGVGAELVAHLREGVGQAAGAEGLGGGDGAHADTTPMVSTLMPGAISL